MHGRERSITGWRQHLWLALLVVATIAFTSVFACAAPFAALGALAALTLSRRDALLLTAEVWAVNQLGGFLLVGYPWTANSAAWGVAIAVAAVLGTLAARWTARRLAGSGLAARAIAALVVAFAVYQAGIAVGSVMLGGAEHLALSIVAQVFAINAVALAGLLGLNALGAVVGLRGRPAGTALAHPA